MKPALHFLRLVVTACALLATCGTASAAAAAPDAILIPKISTDEQLQLIAQRLLSMHTAHKVRIWAMIETPAAIFNVREIAASVGQQNTGMDQIAQGMQETSSATGEFVSGVQQSQEAAENLSRVAGGLRELAAQYKV